MPRSLVLGNGEMLVSLDKHAQVRDFYFPYVGYENHASDCVHRIGLWVEGSFTWLSDGNWDIAIDYEEEALVSHIVAKHKSLGVEVTFSDTVYNEQNIFIRKLIIHNKAPRDRTIKLFFNQQFHIGGFAHGNTAYFDPDLKAIMHYRGSRVFLVSGESGGTSFDDYGIGIFNAEGKDGTWKDAEDGTLSKNPVEHGSVDSTIGFTKSVPADSEWDVHYWVAAAETVYLAKGLNNYIHIKTFHHIYRTTHDFWRAWVNKMNIDFHGLDSKLVVLFKKSLLIMRLLLMLVDLVIMNYLVV